MSLGLFNLGPAFWTTNWALVGSFMSMLLTYHCRDFLGLVTPKACDIRCLTVITISSLVLLSQPFGPVVPVLRLSYPLIWVFAGTAALFILASGKSHRLCCMPFVGFVVGLSSLGIRAYLQPFIGERWSVEAFSSAPIWEVLPWMAKLGYLMDFVGILFFTGYISCCDTPWKGLAAWTVGVTISNLFLGALYPGAFSFYSAVFGGYWFFLLKSLMVVALPGLVVNRIPGIHGATLGLVLSTIGGTLLIISR